ncbi:AIPR family protein [Deinococcus sp. UR1]|uniref:AIPR family protein n=1 Tax=Deinococcus sp. UR1 TaxID=1704277 RepID=UPI000AE5219D|nr:AIPR family protein [Deinococcus sp. UR1]PIG96436.1 hypothetical protein AMD26_017360 [Deinococcus sp. UR1]
MTQNTLQVGRIESMLTRTFDGKIDISDWSRHGEEQQKNAFLTRSLAALIAASMANIEVDEAVKYITDGYKDSGIDLIYYDEYNKYLYLIQTKFIRSGNGGPSSSDITPFLNGVDIVLNQEYDEVNEKIRSHRDMIFRAIDDINTKIVGIIAYTGNQISGDALRSIDRAARKINGVSLDSPIIEFRTINLPEIYRIAQRGVAENSIDVELVLTDYGQLRDPYQGIYGQIAATDLAKLWDEYETRLLAKNIRKFLGDNVVNSEVQSTLLERPQQFVYLNNGITIICSSVNRKPRGGSSRDVGIFEIKGMSIVNGAQTIGNIGKTSRINAESVEKAKVIVKILSLQDAPDNFSSEVTRAANTQTRIERRDFVALDPRQDDLKNELAMEGINYIFKAGESAIPGTSFITLEEATSALACASSSLNYALLSKKEIGKLWADTDSPPYTDLFSRSLTSYYLSNLVYLYRDILFIISETERASGEKRYKQTCQYGDRLITKLAIEKLDLHILKHEKYSDSQIKQQVEDLVPRITDIFQF